MCDAHHRFAGLVHNVSILYHCTFRAIDGISSKQPGTHLVCVSREPMWPTITTHQSAAARARAYSEAVRASTNANGNIVTLQQPPSSPRPSSTSTARTTPHKAHKKEIKTKSKRTIPASPTGTVPPSHAHPVARARHARRSSSASSSTSLGTRIRKEAAQVAAELLSNQAPAPAQQGAPKPPVEDVLAADGQAWMQFLQRTAAQLEQEVAKLPVEHVTTGSTRGLYPYLSW